MRSRRWRAVAAAVLVGCAGIPLGAQTPDLTTLSLEALLNIEVTSVSRREEQLLRTAAAVYVITEDDIRRSGATTLPDLFRMVPGLSVAQLNVNTWSVTARGFGGTNANKLLVLIDGRSIYTPLNGGVNWEMQLLPLDTISQIEVIRGPGGSLWGTNAINGVINIITKSADRAQGGHLRAYVGRYEPGAVDFSYGGTFGAGGSHVTHGRYVQRRSLGLTAGSPNGDDIEAVYGRTRLDWAGGVNRLFFQTDLQSSNGDRVASKAQLSPPFRTFSRLDASSTSGSAVLSWTRSASSRVESGLQVSYSGFSQSDLSETSHELDVDARQHRRIGVRHDIVAGIAYRSTVGRVAPDSTITILPAYMHRRRLSGFLLDEVVVTDTLHVSAGAKLEGDQDTEMEVQPSVRGLWALSPRQSLWAAVSRAVRTPNRYERGMFILVSASPGPAGMPVAVTLEGSKDTSSEILTEYELGYRVYRRAYSLDATAFVGSYADLASHATGPSRVDELQGIRVIRVPLTARNDAAAVARGAEIAATWKPIRWGQVWGSYAHIDIDFGTPSGPGGSVQTVPINGPVPRHNLYARGAVDLPRGVQATALFYRASAIRAIDIRPASRLDLRVAWLARRGVQLAAGVQNLLHGESPEYADRTSRAVPSPVRISPYGEASWRF